MLTSYFKKIYCPPLNSLEIILASLNFTLIYLLLRISQITRNYHEAQLEMGCIVFYQGMDSLLALKLYFLQQIPVFCDISAYVIHHFLLLVIL